MPRQHVDFTTPGGKVRLQRIQEVLSGPTPLNVHEAAAALGMHKGWAGRNIGALHNKGPKRVYIAEWRPWHSETWMLPCYAWGDLPDAPRPEYPTNQVRAERRREIRADPDLHERFLAKQRARRTPEGRAAEFQRWKANNPEAYAERLKKTAELNRKRREAKRAAEAEKQRRAAKRAAEAERKRLDPEEQAMRQILREARREARGIEDPDERRRFIEVQKIVKKPRPDPFVGLFFGKAAA
jgi:hypothetical protein